jgi:hypothetical protein
VLVSCDVLCVFCFLCFVFCFYFFCRESELVSKRERLIEGLGLGGKVLSQNTPVSLLQPLVLLVGLGILKYSARGACESFGQHS